MPKAWKEVVDSPVFQGLALKERKQLRDQYFEEAVAPQIPEPDRKAAYNQFLVEGWFENDKVMQGTSTLRDAGDFGVGIAQGVSTVAALPGQALALATSGADSGFAKTVNEKATGYFEFFDDVNDSLQGFKSEDQRLLEEAPIVYEGYDGSTEFNLPNTAQFSNAIAGSIAPGGAITKGGSLLARGASKALPALGATGSKVVGYGTANTALVAPGTYADTYEQSLDQSKADGIDAILAEDRARGAGATAAGIVAPVAAVTGGLGSALSASQVGSLPVRALKGGLYEAPGEAIEEGAQSLATDYGIGRDLDYRRAGGAATLGAAAGAGQGGVMASLEGKRNATVDPYNENDIPNGPGSEPVSPPPAAGLRQRPTEGGLPEVNLPDYVEGFPTEGQQPPPPPPSGLSAEAGYSLEEELNRIDPNWSKDPVQAMQEAPPTQAEVEQILNSDTPIEEVIASTTGVQPVLPGSPPLSTAEKLRATASTGQLQEADSANLRIIADGAEAASSPLNDLPEPTELQKEAGNYKKGHTKVQGLDISIETPRGGNRSGVDQDGESWSVTMQNDYGYIRKTKGADGEQVDAYIGSNPTSPKVFVVDQIDANTRDFDEHKVMVGYDSQEEAEAAYIAGFSDGKGEQRLGSIFEMPMQGFKKWLKDGKTTKPVAYTPASQNPTTLRPIKDDVAVLPNGTEIPIQYAIIDADELIASQSDDMSANPRYPAELQPRDRTRTTSLQQIQRIAQTLNPRLLGEQVSATDGAPIISEDGVVESGNGRVLAIRQAYTAGMATSQEYAAALATAGYPVQGVRRPVLVRVRKGKMDTAQRLRFTRDANERTTAVLSSTEQAKADAANMPENIVALFKGGELSKVENRPFIRAFIQSAIGQNEQGNFITKDNEVSNEAIRRVKLALLYQAYGNEKLLETVAEEVDGEVRGLAEGLVVAAPEWSKMRMEAASGNIAEEVDITDKLLTAVQMIRDSRQNSKPIQSLLLQNDMFGGNVDPTVEALVRSLYTDQKMNRLMTFGRIADMLIAYTDTAQKTNPGADMFGYTVGKAEVLNAITKARTAQNEEAEQQAGLFDQQPTGERNGGADAEVRTANPEPSREELQEAGSGNVQTPNEQIAPKPVKSVAVQKLSKKARTEKAGSTATLPAKPATKKPEVIQDAGEKIGGARKDQWKDRGLLFSDIENLTAAEQYTLATKDTVWPKQDYKKMVESGKYTATQARLIKFYRDALTPAPRYDSVEARRGFIDLTSKIRKVLEDFKSTSNPIEDVSKIVEAHIAEYRKYTGSQSLRVPKEISDYAFAAFQSTKKLSVGIYDMLKMKREIDKGWPTLKRTPLKKTAQEDGKETPSRPHLDSLKRTGKDFREGRDVGSDDFLKDFGFRGIEFGNWVAGDERQRGVNYAYDALMDLALVLNVDPRVISLNGSMGLAFGSRGSGRAAAHYESDKLVINLTKIKGAGTLAHEWGHALDHYLGKLERDLGDRGRTTYASGGRDTYSARKLDNLRAEVRETFDALMTSLFKKDKEAAEIIRDRELQLENLESTIKKVEGYIERESAKDSSSKHMIKDWNRWLDANRGSVANLKERLEAERAGQITPVKTRTDYAKQADKLGKYWQRPTELFARAFEAYVFDRILDKGDQNDYLVQGVEGERYADPMFAGNPYPRGLERLKINTAFDNLFEALQVRNAKDDLPTYFLRSDTPVRDMPLDGMQQLYGADVLFQPVRNWDKKRTRLSKAANQEFERIFGKGASLKVVDRLYEAGGDEVFGVFTAPTDRTNPKAPKIIDFIVGISLSPRNGNVMGALRHELIHLIRRSGAINPTTWAELEQRAREGWIKDYNIMERYYDHVKLAVEKRYDTKTPQEQAALIERAMLEEAIAEAYSDYITGKRSFSARILAFFKQLAEFMGFVRKTAKANGVNEWQDVFNAIDRGEYKNKATVKTIMEMTGGYATSFQRSEAYKAFYSQLERQIQALSLNKAPATQWKNIVQNLTSRGVKKEEIEWSGINAWLDNHKPTPAGFAVLESDGTQVASTGTKASAEEIAARGTGRTVKATPATSTITKQEIIDYLQTEGALEITEIEPKSEYSEDVDLYFDDGEVIDPDKDFIKENAEANYLDDEIENVTAEYELQEIEATEDEIREEAMERAIQRAERDYYDEPDIKYTDREYGYEIYSSTGDFYSVSLPGDNGTSEYIDQEFGSYRDAREAAVNHASKKFKKTDAKEDKYAKYTIPGLDQSTYHEILFTIPSVRFENSHYDDTNVIMHVRFNDRNTAAGRTLFIEEVQSDLHQAGRKKGYKAGIRVPVTNFETWAKEKGYTEEESAEIWESKGRGGSKNYTAWAEWTEFSINQNQAANKEANAVPNAPFKSSWHEYVMKRMLRYAAEDGGYDAIAWTTGAQQADRYNLQRFVKKIEWENDGSAGGRSFTIKAYDAANRQVIERNKVKPVDLGELVGTRLAAEITKEAEKEDKGTISGDGLALGGGGMKGFYDNMLVKYMNSYVKKWGAKVESSSLDGEMVYKIVESDGVYHVHAFMKGKQGTRIGSYSSKANAQSVADAYNKQVGSEQQIWSVPITEQMMDSVMDGQPLFQRAPLTPKQEGEIEFLDNITGGYTRWMYRWFMRNAFDMDVKQGHAKYNIVAQFGRMWLRSNDHNLKTIATLYESKTVDEIRRKLWSPAGENKEIKAAYTGFQKYTKWFWDDAAKNPGVAAQTFDETLREVTQTFGNKLTKALKDMTKKERMQVTAVLQNPKMKVTDRKTLAAAVEITRLLKDYRKFLVESGIDIAETEGYFPREYKRDLIAANREDFEKRAAEVYKITYADQWREQILAEMTTKPDGNQGAWIDQRIDDLAREAAERFAESSILLDQGLDPTARGLKTQSSGGMGVPNNLKPRTLSKEADDILRPYLEQDPLLVLPSMLFRTAKRAIFERFFGGDKWIEYERQMRREGIHADAVQVVRKAVLSSTYNMPQPTTQGGRDLYTFIRTWNYLTFLPRVLLSSLAEPLVVGIRTRSVANALNSVALTAKFIATRNKPSETLEIAEEILGITGYIAENILIQSKFSGEFMTDSFSAVQHEFFRKTGLSALTAAQRQASMVIGMKQIQLITKDFTNPKSKTKKYAAFLLRELGVSDAQMEGFAQWVQTNGLNKGSLSQEAGFGEFTTNARLANTAITRFVNKTIQAPTAAERQYFAQHPVGNLLFSLQAFSYAFAKNVLIRDAKMTKEALTKSGYTIQERYALLPSAFAYGLLLAASYAVRELRDEFFKRPEREKRKDEGKDDLMYKLTLAASSAGLFGGADPYINIYRGFKYDRPAETAMLGPLPGLISQTATAFFGRNAESTNTRERKQAALVYNLFIQPTLNGVAAARLGTYAGAVAIQAISHPQTREAFTTMIAGQEMTKKEKAKAAAELRKKKRLELKVNAK